MVLEYELMLARAEDEIILAKIDMEVSTKNELKEIFGVSENKTFFHSVISHSYYAIFHSARAYLHKREIKISSQGEHKKTFNEFKKIVETGKLDKELLEIYESELTKAEALLRIFKREKKKRGRFTYNIKSNVNLPHADESINHAKEFVSIIKQTI